MVKKFLPPAVLAWLLLGFLASAFCGEARKYRIETAEEVGYARKLVLSKQAPLLHGVLDEAGMPENQVADFFRRFDNQAMVNTQEGQIDYDSERAAEILGALPENVREKFLRLSYQWTGPSSLWRDEVAAALTLEPAQSRQIGEIVIDCLEQLAPANRPEFSYEMTAAQNAAYDRRTTEIEAERDRRLLGVLTPAQRQAWQELIGPPSKALEEFRDYNARHNPR